MKFTAVLALVAAATVVSAETNAHRLARGLSPNPPVKRATPVDMARRGSPSGTPSQCNTGPVNCCDSTETTGSSSSSSAVNELLSLLKIDVPVGTVVGLSCSPITGAGTGSGASCTQQPVCCENNTYQGLINIGCSPININL